MESTLQTTDKVHLKTICILYHLRIHCDKVREFSLKKRVPAVRAPQCQALERLGMCFGVVFIEKDSERTEDLIWLSKSKCQLKNLY